eukprot:354423-Chlamydomonas_euryale.AAC.10
MVWGTCPGVRRFAQGRTDAFIFGPEDSGLATPGPAYPDPEVLGRSRSAWASPSCPFGLAARAAVAPQPSSGWHLQHHGDISGPGPAVPTVPAAPTLTGSSRSRRGAKMVSMNGANVNSSQTKKSPWSVRHCMTAETA